MLYERLDAAAMDPGNQDPDRKSAIEEARKGLQVAGVKDPGPRRTKKGDAVAPREVVFPSEFDLDAEWQRQAGRYVELGFADILKMTEEEYLESLPRFAEQPEEYKDRFNLPLLVETRIPWQEQAKRSGIVVSGYVNSQRPVLRDGLSVLTNNYPVTPYTGWFNIWGERFPKRIGSRTAHSQLAGDEYGGCSRDGVALQIAFPQFTENKKYFHLIGDRIRPYDVPALRHTGRGPEVCAVGDSFASVNFRPLVRGIQVVTVSK